MHVFDLQLNRNTSFASPASLLCFSILSSSHSATFLLYHPCRPRPESLISYVIGGQNSIIARICGQLFVSILTPRPHGPNLLSLSPYPREATRLAAFSSKKYLQLEVVGGSLFFSIWAGETARLCRATEEWRKS